MLTDASAVCGKQRYGRRKRLAADVGECEVSPRGGQLHRQSLTDAAARARDDGDFICEIECSHVAAPKNFKVPSAIRL